MRAGYRRIFWAVLALIILMSAIIIAVITDLSLFRTTPLLYTATMAIIGTGMALLMRNRQYLPLLRNFRLTGKLMLAPLLLLLFSTPAALIFISYDLNGREPLKLLSALFASLAAVSFLATVVVVTLPSLAAVLLMTGKPTCRIRQSDRLKVNTYAATALMALLSTVINRLTDFDGAGAVLVFPLLALALVLLFVFIVSDFKITLSEKINAAPVPEKAVTDDFTDREKTGGFNSLLLFAEHYIDIISDRMDFLNLYADDDYASETVTVACKSFDPALLPALQVIYAESRFSEKVRSDAGAAIQNIEKYYSDPLRNRELLRLPGISEKAATARGHMFRGRPPQVAEIVKLLGDTSPEIRRIGLAAAGRYNVTELRDEILQALGHPETAAVAYHVLRHFGPGVYGDIIGSALRADNSERENLMIIRLLQMMPLPDALPYLFSFVATGHMGVRLKAVGSLCERGYVPQGNRKQLIEETLDETLHTIARLIALQLEAGRTRHFILAAALDQERALNNNFLRSLLTLLTGRAAASVIMPSERDGGTYFPGIAAEAIDAVADGPLRRPLRALLGNDNDRSRLAELALFYPVREIKGRSLASFILSSEQNITGIWTKACALHKVAAEGKGLDREQAVSYLFSNSQLLQEESARAIRSVDAGWYEAAESRLTPAARSRIAGVVEGKLPQTAMIFEKTRFLSLCFNNIPGENIILLASAMRYSESHDAESMPGQITWVVPSKDGKSGLYSLPVRVIADFVFHYSEYTDIFVHYMDNPGGLTVD